MKQHIRNKVIFKGEPEKLIIIRDLLQPSDPQIFFLFEHILPLDGKNPLEVWGVDDECEESDSVLYHNQTILEYTFDTVNRVPLPVYRKLADMFSDAKLEIHYASEDLGDNCGIYNLLIDGSLSFSEPDDPFLFACEIWNKDPEEEMAERAINFYEE